MGLTNEEKIKKLKEELSIYQKKDKKRVKLIKEKQEIKKLQKQIHQKKYSDVKRVGSNIKTIGKSIGKQFGKILKDTPNKKKFDMDKLLRDLPQ